MRLFSFGQTGPVAGHDDVYKTNVLARRWLLELNATSVVIDQQALRAGECWASARGQYYMVGVLWPPREWLRGLGYRVVEYDGYHNTFQVGPFYVAWEG